MITISVFPTFCNKVAVGLAAGPLWAKAELPIAKTNSTTKSDNVFFMLSIAILIKFLLEVQFYLNKLDQDWTIKILCVINLDLCQIMRMQIVNKQPRVMLG